MDDTVIEACTPTAMRARLASPEPILLMGVRLARTTDVAPIARAAGFDGLFVDLEHSTMPLDAAVAICDTARALGLAGCVRVPPRGIHLVGPLLDAGVVAVVCPRVSTAAAAADFVGSCRYPPAGQRSVSGINAAHAYRRLPFNGVTDEPPLCVLMIETAEGVAAAEEIAGTSGVDAVLVGSNDLSVDLGCPGDVRHSSVRAATERIAAACAQADVAFGVGGLGRDSELLETAVARGARLIVGGFDVGYLLDGATSDAEHLRRSVTR